MNARILIAILLLILVAACGDTETTDEVSDVQTQTLEGWTVQLTPQSGALEAGEELFLLELTDQAGPIEPETFEVDAWMPMHGHGTMKPTEVEKIEAGVYEARVIFSMPGAWQVRVDTDGDRFYEFDVEVAP